MNDIVCKIYDYDIDRYYDGIIYNGKVYELDHEAKPIKVSKQILSNHIIGLFFIDEIDFSEIREDKKYHRWGYFSIETGDIIINPIYDEAYPFYGGRACIKLLDRYGYIDCLGNEIIPPIYEYLDCKFEKNLCVAKKDNKFGYIDKKGKKKIRFKFQFGSEFLVCENKVGIQTLYAVVKINNRFGIIDENGEYILVPKYEELKQVYFEDVFIAKLKGEYGMIQLENKIGRDKLIARCIVGHIFDDFGTIITTKEDKKERLYCMRLGKRVCVINRKFEMFFSEENEKNVNYKGKNVIVNDKAFDRGSLFKYKKFRGLDFME